MIRLSQGLGCECWQLMSFGIGPVATRVGSARRDPASPAWACASAARRCLGRCQFHRRDGVLELCCELRRARRQSGKPGEFGRPIASSEPPESHMRHNGSRSLLVLDWPVGGVDRRSGCVSGAVGRLRYCSLRQRVHPDASRCRCTVVGASYCQSRHRVSRRWSGSDWIRRWQYRAVLSCSTCRARDLAQAAFRERDSEA